jgi:hypothetical protein
VALPELYSGVKTKASARNQEFRSSMEKMGKNKALIEWG